jgi:hypothetical protein
MSTALSVNTLVVLPALVTAASDRAEIRFVEFFAGQIRNPHTRRAYSRAVGEFLTWCASAGGCEISDRPSQVRRLIRLRRYFPRPKRRACQRDGGV